MSELQPYTHGGGATANQSRGPSNRVQENFWVSFGRYLRELRERRGLSLAQVAERTRQSAFPLDRGTLSRFENGRQRIAFGPLVALARIYDVSPDVLAERLELDSHAAAESDQTADDEAEADGPGRPALSGPYAIYRARRDRATGAAVDDEATQIGRRLATISAARSTGKNRWAAYELDQLSGSPLGDVDAALVLLLQANCHRCLGDLETAETLLGEARRIAEAIQDELILGNIAMSEGALAMQGDQARLAVERLNAAYRHLKDGPAVNQRIRNEPRLRVGVLMLLAEARLNLGDAERAGRTARATRSLATSSRDPKGQTYGDLWLAKAQELAGNSNGAARGFAAVSKRAGQLRHPRLQFMAELALYRQHLEAGRSALANVARRRIERLIIQVPHHIPGAEEFYERTDGRLGRVHALGHPLEQGGKAVSPRGRGRLWRNETKRRGRPVRPDIEERS